VTVAPALAIALVVLHAAGCAPFWSKPTEQRTTEGLTAEQVFTYRVLRQNGREPNFEEWRTWRDDMDERISAYLREHPDAANAFDMTKFRLLRQTSVGMTKPQVQILLGPPEGTTSDAAQIEKVARRYWPLIKEKATEVWVYPLGWNLYFAGDRLIDITQYLP
jgi:hypothetical protein